MGSPAPPSFIKVKIEKKHKGGGRRGNVVPLP
jgi:hypothetical protein